MLLINISGIEGVGKSSAALAVADFLDTNNIPHTNTREPGGTLVAEKIRDLLKNYHPEDGEQFDPLTELLLFYASRNQSFKNVVVPMLAKNKVVITDRSFYCSFAYQVRGSNIVSESDFWAIHNVVMRGMPEYDLIIHLYTETIEQGFVRARGRGELDRIEKNEMDFFRRADAGYKEIFAGKKNVLSINTTVNDEDAVKRIITERLETLLSAA